MMVEEASVPVLGYSSTPPDDTPASHSVLQPEEQSIDSTAGAESSSTASTSAALQARRNEIPLESLQRLYIGAPVPGAQGRLGQLLRRGSTTITYTNAPSEFPPVTRLDPFNKKRILVTGVSNLHIICWGFDACILCVYMAMIRFSIYTLILVVKHVLSQPANVSLYGHVKRTVTNAKPYVGCRICRVSPSRPINVDGPRCYMH